MKRITSEARLTPEEVSKYDRIRQQIDEEMPEIMARHEQRMTAIDQLQKVLAELKNAREAQGLSLADLAKVTGMDRSALSKLETGNRPNPTVVTLVRYAVAVGKSLKLSLTDEIGE